MLIQMIICGIVFTVLYVNNMFQLMPSNWVELFFHVEFLLFVCFIIMELRKQNKNK
ncbi:hypothetical protein Bcop_1896 [Bacteroides coprosuis DSM 18011]|jgi:uncharacterized protein (DUF983 family)|uniref:Uncharacterized protein n=1 Tax=Bacteroides coprosuis DSM 18011 TaxID=679937 RepID=F3ZS61_9BACE|nr:hypothetical protein Bcop_1896 [Bacteroides coprosuis DSM 18011]